MPGVEYVVSDLGCIGKALESLFNPSAKTDLPVHPYEFFSKLRSEIRVWNLSGWWSESSSDEASDELTKADPTIVRSENAAREAGLSEI